MNKVEDKNRIPELLKSMPKETEEILRHVGAYLEGEIKETIERTRPEWPALKPATIAHKKSSKPLIDTGTMWNAVTHTVSVRTSIVTVGIFGEEAKRAAAHELGAPSRNIPQRAFIRPTFDAQKEKLMKMIDRDVAQAIKKRELS